MKTRVVFRDMSMANMLSSDQFLTGQAVAGLTAASSVAFED